MVVVILEEMAKLAQPKFCNRIVPFQAVVSMVGQCTTTLYVLDGGNVAVLPTHTTMEVTVTKQHGATQDQVIGIKQTLLLQDREQEIIIEGRRSTVYEVSSDQP